MATGRERKFVALLVLLHNMYWKLWSCPIIERSHLHGWKLSGDNRVWKRQHYLCTDRSSFLPWVRQRQPPRVGSFHPSIPKQSNNHPERMQCSLLVPCDRSEHGQLLLSEYPKAAPWRHPRTAWWDRLSLKPLRTNNKNSRHTDRPPPWLPQSTIRLFEW